MKAFGFILFFVVCGIYELHGLQEKYPLIDNKSKEYGDYARLLLNSSSEKQRDSTVLLKAYFGKIPKMHKEVDLRSRMSEYGVFSSKNQGQRPSCSVFAVVGALEYQYAVLRGEAKRFSEEYLIWATFRESEQSQDRLKDFYDKTEEVYPDIGFTIPSVFTALGHYGILLKEDALYTFEKGYTRLQVPSTEVVKKAKLTVNVTPHKVPAQDADTLVDNIIHALNNQIPVIVAIKFPKTNQLRKVHFLNQQKTHGNHAVLVVGYKAPNKNKKETVFIFKNSWGPKWGLGGYGFISYDYMHRNLLEAYFISVDNSR